VTILKSGGSSASVVRWLTLHRCKLNSTELPASELDSLITTLHGPHGKHNLYFWQSLYTASLRSNSCPVVPRAFFCGNVFSDPLPSNGHGADHIENTSCNTFSIVVSDAPSQCYIKQYSERGIWATSLFSAASIAIHFLLNLWHPVFMSLYSAMCI
jgi:hypothetical protein